jgi:hypothetical protein
VLRTSVQIGRARPHSAPRLYRFFEVRADAPPGESAADMQSDGHRRDIAIPSSRGGMAMSDRDRLPSSLGKHRSDHDRTYVCAPWARLRCALLDHDLRFGDGSTDGLRTAACCRTVSESGRFRCMGGLTAL